MPVNCCIFYKYMGHIPYAESEAIQEELHKSLVDGNAGMDGCILLLSHEPVITFGKYSTQKHLLVDEEKLSEKGIKLYRSSRGGDVTCHEPGQLVIYPILNLKKLRIGVKQYVGMLEESVIGFLSEFDIAGNRVDGRPGIWIGNKKIASIGINISRHVTSHGVAINLSNSLATFGYVNPCGYPGMGMTSLIVEKGECSDLESAGQLFIKHFDSVFNIKSEKFQVDAKVAGLGS